MMILGGEEGLECEVCVDGTCLEYVSEFKYLGSGTAEAECNMKMASERRIAGAIRSLVNATSLGRECARALHESLLMPALTYGSETMIWRKKK